MTFDQAEFAIRCEWGERGVSQLSPISDAGIIGGLAWPSTVFLLGIPPWHTWMPAPQTALLS